MGTKWGRADELGPIAYGEEDEEVFLGRSVTQHKGGSDDTARRIDEVVRGILDKAYGRTTKILTDNLDKLHAMAKLLLEYETIDVPMIDAVMENRESPPPMGWTQGGPGKDEPKPITIGGPAAQTCVAKHVMSRRPAPAPAFPFDRKGVGSGQRVSVRGELG